MTKANLKSYIKGIEDLLMKIYPKIPDSIFKTILAEANDNPLLIEHGFFVFDHARNIVKFHFKKPNNHQST